MRPRKGNRYSRRFLRRLISGAPYTVSTIQKNSDEAIQANVRDYNNLLQHSAPEPATSDQKNNVNIGKNGVEPITLKVYNWFDNPATKGQDVSARQVGELIAAGKVAVKVTPADPEIWGKSF